MQFITWTPPKNIQLAALKPKKTGESIEADKAQKAKRGKSEKTEKHYQTNRLANFSGYG